MHYLGISSSISSLSLQMRPSQESIMGYGAFSLQKSSPYSISLSLIFTSVSLSSLTLSLYHRVGVPLLWSFGHLLISSPKCSRSKRGGEKRIFEVSIFYLVRQNCPDCVLSCKDRGQVAALNVIVLLRTLVELRVDAISSEHP